MGMFDYVVVLDERLSCPKGHQLDGFQTKSFDDPSMDTYLISGPYVYLVSRSGLRERDENSTAHWRWTGRTPSTRAGMPSARSYRRANCCFTRSDGLKVMDDDEPLALAHREIRTARDAGTYRRRAT